MTIILQKKKRSSIRERLQQPSSGNSGSFPPDDSNTAPSNHRAPLPSSSNTLPQSPSSHIVSAVVNTHATNLGPAQPYSASHTSQNTESIFSGRGGSRRRPSSGQQPQLVHVVQQQYPTLLQTSQQFSSAVGSTSRQSASLVSNSGGDSSSSAMHHRRYSDFEEDPDNEEDYDSENYSSPQQQQRGPNGSNGITASVLGAVMGTVGARRSNINPSLFASVSNDAVDHDSRQSTVNDGEDSCSAADGDVDSQYYADVNNQLTEEEWMAREQHFAVNVKRVQNFDIKEMVGDGACLFRAVADQVLGDQEMHDVVRKHCCDYMVRNMDFFSQYLTEDFHEYITRKRLLTTHADHLEVQALAEIYNRPIEVYEYNVTPINIFQNSAARSAAAGRSPPTHSNSSSAAAAGSGTAAQQQQKPLPIRVSYHRRCHYNSLRHPYEATVGVGLGLPGLEPGGAERSLLQDALQQSERTQLEACMLEDKLVASDIDATQNALQEEIERQSYMEWMQQVGRSDQQNSPRNHSAAKQPTASSSSASIKSQSSTSPISNHMKAADSKPVSAVILCSSGSSAANRVLTRSASRQNSPLAADSNVSNTRDSENTVDTQPPLTRKLSPKRDINTVNNEDDGSAATVDVSGATLARSDKSKGSVTSSTSSGNVPTTHVGNSAVLYSSFGDFVPEAEEDDVLAQVLAISRQEYFASQARRGDGCSTNSNQTTGDRGI